MNRKQNDLPNVNEYIEKYNLKPSDTEKLYGHCYNLHRDRTYLVIYKNNTYTSLNNMKGANLYAGITDGSVVVCKGEIK